MAIRLADRVTRRLLLGLIVLSVAALLFAVPARGPGDVFALTVVHRYAVAVAEGIVPPELFQVVLALILRSAGPRVLFLALEGSAPLVHEADTLAARRPDEVSRADLFYDPDDGYSFTGSFTGGHEATTPSVPPNILAMLPPPAATTATATAPGAAALLLLDARGAAFAEGLVALCLSAVLVVLAVLGARQFSRDAARLVIRPVQRMLAWTEAVAARPLGRLSARGLDAARHGNAEVGEVCDTMVNLAGLLQVGFGDAGAPVIAAYLQARGPAPQPRGRRVHALFLFSGARDFDRVAAAQPLALGEYAAAAASSVHAAVAGLGGSVNKNTGSSVLSVFRQRQRPARRRLARLCALARAGLVDVSEAEAVAVAAALDAASDSDDEGDLDPSQVTQLLRPDPARSRAPPGWQALAAEARAHGPPRAQPREHPRGDSQLAGQVAGDATPPSPEEAARPSRWLPRHCPDCGDCAACGRQPQPHSGAGDAARCLCPPWIEYQAAAALHREQQQRRDAPAAATQLPAVCLSQARAALGYDLQADLLATYGYDFRRNARLLWQRERARQLLAGQDGAAALLARARAPWSACEDEAERGRRMASAALLPPSTCVFAASLALLFAARKKRLVAEHARRRLCAESSEAEVQLLAARALMAGATVVTGARRRLGGGQWGAEADGDAGGDGYSESNKSVFPSSIRDGSGGARAWPLGVGLHAGWAVEGAIGSRHKLDASYLSPSVNLAARLEAAAAQYGLPLLLSGVVHGLLPEALARRCRLVDCVAVKGSRMPVDLYTLDLGPGADAEAEDLVAAAVRMCEDGPGDGCEGPESGRSASPPASRSPSPGEAFAATPTPGATHPSTPASPAPASSRAQPSAASTASTRRLRRRDHSPAGTRSASASASTAAATQPSGSASATPSPSRPAGARLPSSSPHASSASTGASARMLRSSLGSRIGPRPGTGTAGPVRLSDLALRSGRARRDAQVPGTSTSTSLSAFSGTGILGSAATGATLACSSPFRPLANAEDPSGPGWARATFSALRRLPDSSGASGASGLGGPATTQPQPHTITLAAPLPGPPAGASALAWLEAAAAEGGSASPSRHRLHTPQQSSWAPGSAASASTLSSASPRAARTQLSRAARTPTASGATPAPSPDPSPRKGSGGARPSLPSLVASVTEGRPAGPPLEDIYESDDGGAEEGEERQRPSGGPAPPSSPSALWARLGPAAGQGRGQGRRSPSDTPRVRAQSANVAGSTSAFAYGLRAGPHSGTGAGARGEPPAAASLGAPAAAPPTPAPSAADSDATADHQRLSPRAAHSPATALSSLPPPPSPPVKQASLADTQARATRRSPRTRSPHPARPQPPRSAAQETRLQALEAAAEHLQRGLPPGFIAVASQGVAAYTAGHWPVARRLLRRAQALVPGDEAVAVVLGHMQGLGNRCPADWPGFRTLERK